MNVRPLACEQARRAGCDQFTCRSLTLLLTGAGIWLAGQVADGGRSTAAVAFV